ncbi:uncharacterized protein LOC127749041 isoform X3 [Frankliniella occidentalis]|uniref:Uncharacterized protein LOC127749041 isoform X3 n=1 Tax=Frankliniella occidentalis TaxID=133901 RepID=A0A9C6TS56_FRAOC|nr:uncharacterized protein LOC127749041 isoform X3 [Frankliniella occidentalis]
MADPVAADAAEEPQAEQVPLPRLPDEMLLEVLQHLPKKSRLRYRLVSRRWNDVVLKSLTSLTVRVDKIKDGSRAVAPLRKLFRGASRLKRIRLSHYYSGARMLNLVKYLAGHPSLTTLDVGGASNLNKLCSNVAAVLPELPALEELQLTMMSSTLSPSLCSRQELVQAIRPHSTPHLSRLLVLFSPTWPPCPRSDLCMHDWLHSESVQEMLAANRGLRLTVQSYRECGESTRPGLCKFCLLGCHEGRKDRAACEVSYLSFQD